MEILLRHAASLARACTDAIAAIRIESTFRLSVNQIGELEMREQIQRRLSRESMEVRTKLDQIRDLMVARGEIRLAIKQANQREALDEPSVESLLNRKAVLDAQLQHLTALHSRFTHRPDVYGRTREDCCGHNVDEVVAALKNVQHRLQTVTSGSVSDSVEIASLPNSDITLIEDDIAAIKRMLAVLGDELAAANLRMKITISNFAVAVLRKHKIIDPAKD